MNVSIGYLGARNDKTIVKVDTFPVDLHKGNHWLRSQMWFCQASNGSVVRFRGCYLICDGGYLRWPSLICPCPHDPDVRVQNLAKQIMSCRKDVECTFGILKKRFACLKAWTECRKCDKICDQFVACCIVHNMLLEHDGYLSSNHSPDEFVDTNKKRGRDGPGLQVSGGSMCQSGSGSTEDQDVSFQDEAGWKERIAALAEHNHVVKNRQRKK